jgi:hypothetical protein
LCSVLFCSVLLCSFLFISVFFLFCSSRSIPYFGSFPLRSVLCLSVPFHPALFYPFVINSQTNWRHVGTFVET